MSEASIKLSIITVARNAAASISHTLASVAAAKGPGIEYIVLDGASEDATVELVKREAPWVDVLHSEPDAGIYDAMNKAAGMARGEWLYFLNAGDAVHPNGLRELLAHTSNRPGVGTISGRVAMLDEHRQPLGYTHPPRTGSVEQLRTSNCVAHQATLMRAEHFRLLGGFRTDLRIMGDYEYWLRSLASGYDILFTDTVVADFVADGVSSRRDRYLLAQEERLLVLEQLGLMTASEAARARLRIRAAFHVKSALRTLLGSKLSHRIAMRRARAS